MHKQKIMEVLLSANNNLTKEDIAWAAQNLNSTNENQEVLGFDHDKNSVFEACGLDESMETEVMREYARLKKSDIDKKSQLIEKVVNEGSPKLIRSFLIRGIMEYEAGKEKIFDDLKKFLDKL